MNVFIFLSNLKFSYYSRLSRHINRNIIIKKHNPAHAVKSSVYPRKNQKHCILLSESWCCIGRSSHHQIIETSSQSDWAGALAHRHPIQIQGLKRIHIHFRNPCNTLKTSRASQLYNTSNTEVTKFHWKVAATGVILSNGVLEIWNRWEINQFETAYI